MSESVEKFTVISEDVQEFFDKILTKLSMPYKLNYRLVNANRQKQIIKLNKLSEMLSFTTGYNAVISFNENLFDLVDDEMVREILVVQELDKISMDIETGRVRTVRPDMTTFSGIIKKYGWESVAKANQLEELANSQFEDTATDEFLTPVKNLG